MKVVLAIIIGLTALTGCTLLPKGASDTLSVLTTSIDNPVTPVTIEQVDRSFNLMVRSANKWAAYCWSQTYKQITKNQPGKLLCTNRRQTRRTLSKYADIANAEIARAEGYIMNNPTLNPAGVIAEAWRAVLAYRDLIPSGRN